MRAHNLFTAILEATTLGKRRNRVRNGLSIKLSVREEIQALPRDRDIWMSYSSVLLHRYSTTTSEHGIDEEDNE